MAKKNVSQHILALLKEFSRPVTTRELSSKLKIAWHTADRYCLKLQLQKKIDCYTIGKSTAWFVKKGDKNA